MQNLSSQLHSLGITIKTPSFVNEITSFLRQEFKCDSPTPQGDAAPISPSSGTPSMPGQGVTQRFFFLPPLLGQILLSWAEILPCPKVPANNKIPMQDHVCGKSVFCWAKHLLLSNSLPAAASSLPSPAEGNMCRQWIPSSFPGGCNPGLKVPAWTHRAAPF